MELIQITGFDILDLECAVFQLLLDSARPFTGPFTGTVGQLMQMQDDRNNAVYVHNEVHRN